MRSGVCEAYRRTTAQAEADGADKRALATAIRANDHVEARARHKGDIGISNKVVADHFEHRAHLVSTRQKKESASTNQANKEGAHLMSLVAPSVGAISASPFSAGASSASSPPPRSRFTIGAQPPKNAPSKRRAQHFQRPTKGGSLAFDGRKRRVVAQSAPPPFAHTQKKKRAFFRAKMNHVIFRDLIAFVIRSVRLTARRPLCPFHISCAYI